MNNIGKTALLVSATMLLNGCFSGEFRDTETPEKNVVIPNIASLFALANDFPIGVAVPAGDFSNSIIARDDLQEVVNKHFNQITAENIMKPAYLQPNAGDFYFDEADALIAYAETNNISIHGHTLVWHEQSPEWMQACADAAECSEFLETHVTTVVQQYADSIATWDVVNEAFYHNGEYRNEDKNGEKGSFWFRKLGKDFITQAFSAARAADPDAELYYNDYSIEQNNDKLASVITMVNELQTAADDGSSVIDGIGFQMHVQSDSPSIEAITASFKKAAATGLKVKITELDVQMNADGSATTLTTALAEKQQLRYQEIVGAYLTEVPSEQRGGISVWGVSDSDSWIISLYGNPDWPLLFDDQLNQKAAIQGFADALQADSDTPPVTDPETSGLFTDSFTDGVFWTKKEASTVDATLAHNATDGTMDIDVDWIAEKTSFDIAVAFDTAVDITDGASLTLKVKMPAANVTDGNVIIQPFLEDINYAPAYTGWLVGGFVADGWVTLTVTGLDPDFGYGYVGEGFDFTQVKGLGLQIIAAEGAGIPTKGTIQIDDVMLIDGTSSPTVPETPTTPETPETPEPAYLVNFDFADSEQGWASNTYGDAPEAAITHNATDEHIDVVLAAEGQHTIQVALDEAITVSAGMVLKVDVKMPAANVTAGDMTIQPFLQDGNYAGIYPGDNADFTADTWTTIKVTLTAEQANSVDEITTLGLQIKSANSNGTSGQAIQIDNISIVE